MTERHEVAIVGAGAVGLQLACLLAQRGVDVVVLERRTSVSTASRAIGVHPPGLAALDAVGVGDAVRGEAVPIRVGIALSGGRELARMRFAPVPIASLPQHRTEALLRQRLAELAPDALRTGADVVGLDERASSVALHLDGGERIEASRVVGADGVRSTVRQLAGIAWRPRRGSAPYAMADGPDGTGEADAALLHLEPDGIVESFPMPSGARRWVARLALREDGMPVERLQAILDGRLLEPPRLPEAAPVSTFVARQRMAAGFVRDRILLIGDAAHEVSPIGGQGMSLGWLDALALDAALATGGDGALAAYDRARRRKAEHAMRRAAWNMAMGAPARGAVRRARLALVHGLALPPGRRLLTAAFTMRGL